MINNKVAQVNLEYGSPTVAEALQKMKNALTTFKGQGYKAVIIIHGYGSTGVGGAIKAAVRKCLGESAMRGIVRMFVGGEDWTNNKRTAIAFCKMLENYERDICSNFGVTVVVLR